MLDIKVWVADHKCDAISRRLLNGCLCTAWEAISAVEQAYGLRELSSRRGGASGHKAWISVQKDDISLMLYFMGPDVDFELGRKGVPEDESYCHGELPRDQLGKLLTMMDAGNDPTDYLKETALTIDCSRRR